IRDDLVTGVQTCALPIYTFDMPTTGGSVLLEGSIPSHDAFLVKKLRDAGVIILAKVNMSEFASAGAYSSLGGQSRNPHDLWRSQIGRASCRETVYNAVMA